ncbi:MAG TPA: hypothetical protein H9810_08350 [Candidatus Gemmiger excrementavium]|uniref:Uncharacterized protein n=1 Tax=Candidatus Gemmiger excrementavium TaxID=2838608 RepID=A0A9D2JGH9_9FIRM|nr:hypothetical protein [Candidatus Gemmiger excrementavium]
MRLLFLLDSVENPASANALLGRRLAGELTALGHTVHLLELWDGQTLPPAPPRGVTAHRLAFADERLMNTALENGAKGGTPVPLRLARLAAHPTAVAAAFRQLVLHAPRRTVECRRTVQQLDAQHHFDAVCAVCAPYRTAFALETARISGKKLLWQLDPYASNRDYVAPGGFAREGKLLDATDAAFITPQALPDYEGGPLTPWRGKVRVLGFPALLPGADVPPHSGTRCVFCGSLYPTLREPDFALELFAALNAPDLTLTMAGGGWQRFEEAAHRAADTLGERFVRPGPLPPAQAAALEAGADILLNLGNAYDNQMPSKLFGYLGSGKPVLHLAVSDRDPTLPYLARYPLALVLHRKDGVTPATIAALRRWLADVTGRRLPYEQVAALYPEFTPQRVAEDFLAVL